MTQLPVITLQPPSRLLLLGLISMCLGCGGGGRAEVSGRVTRSDDSPLVGARVMLRSASTGVSARGVTDEYGRYVLGVEKKGDGVPPGEYTVAISEDRGSWDSPKPRTIHGRYESPKTSGLTLLVEPGADKVYDLQLDLAPQR